MYDIVGDIHGHHQPLCQLLELMGYEEVNNTYKHPEARKVVFVGDYIDRGPEIFLVLRLVRNMIDAGDAFATMGNHEFNALAYHTPDGKGGFCRPHTPKNRTQHEQTLGEVALAPEEWKSHVEWMRTLPLFLELKDFRIVHACWDATTIGKLKMSLGGNQFTSTDQIIEASDSSKELFHLVEDTLKGKEIKLPSGMTFHDKDGQLRDEIRVKWWEDPRNMNLKNYSVIPISDLPEVPTRSDFDFYKAEEDPVFFGHYWLSGTPKLQSPNVCCLDYSIAKGGKLVAYRWDDSKILSETNFVMV